MHTDLLKNSVASSPVGRPRKKRKDDIQMDVTEIQ